MSDTEQTCSSKATRDANRRAFGKRLRKAIGAADMPIQHVADVSPVGRTRLHRIINGDEGASPELLWQIAEPVRVALAASLAESCGYTVQRAEPREVTHVEVVKEACDVIMVITEAMADGQLTPREASRLRLEIAELREVLASIDATCREVLR